MTEGPQPTRNQPETDRESFRSENAEKSPQGRVVAPGSEQERDAALALAFDYRGDVTLETAGGTSVTGYLYNRAPVDGKPCAKVMLPDGGEETVPEAEVVKVSFSGKDPAAGQTWENWLRRYVEQKASGKEAGIRSDFE